LRWRAVNALASPGWRPAAAYRRAAWDLGQGFAVYLLLYVHEQRCAWLPVSGEPGVGIERARVSRRS
jgi:hypothetical protein